MQKLVNLIVHCTYTPYNREITADDIVMMHCCAKNLGNGTYRFMGSTYIDCTIGSQKLLLPSGKTIKANLINGNGWSKPGYSDLINRAGKLINIVPYNFDPYIEEFEITNGARGYNKNSRHIVLAGGWDKNNNKVSDRKDKLFLPEEIFVEKQLITLDKYIDMQIEAVPDLNVIGHQEVSSKLCPGYDFKLSRQNKK